MRNVLIVLIALLVLSSCNLFTVRDSNPPGVAASWNDFATTWELALQNLENCYEDSRNAVHYTGIFRGDYRFHFAPQDVSDYAITPTWTRVEEQDMIQLLHTRYEKIQVELSPVEQLDIISGNDVILYRAYTLSGNLRNQNTGRINLANGNLELHYKKEYGYWYIDKWYDYRAASGGTWGKLKHENY